MAFEFFEFDAQDVGAGHDDETEPAGGDVEEGLGLGLELGLGLGLEGCGVGVGVGVGGEGGRRSGRNAIFVGFGEDYVEIRIGTFEFPPKHAMIGGVNE